MAGSRKRVVALLFGGRSAEHEISLRSAATVLASLDRSRFEPVLLGIDRSGRWHVIAESHFHALLREPLPAVPEEGETTAIVPGASPLRFLSADTGNAATPEIDVVFPVLHGSFGEDGTVQGFLELLDVPYVGAGVLGSAVGMDKDVQKRLLREAGLPIVPFLAVREWEWCRDRTSILHRASALHFPVFVKPARLGSSVGVNKVHQPSSLLRALEAAFEYDEKVLIEQGVRGREIECAVLGGGSELRASLPGEIRPRSEFYSYAAKYLDDNGAELLAPAPLDEETARRVRQLAIMAFQVLECFGMGRVDFFLDPATGDIFVNEINTIPGFTSVSMYPRLWQLSGIALPELVGKLLELAMERHRTLNAKKRIPSELRSE